MALLRRHWIALGVVILVAVVALLLAIAQDQHTLKIRSAVAARDTSSPGYVAALVGSPVSEGNSYEVLTNGDQIFPAMLAAIDAARDRISFETYVYESGSVADRFNAAFEAAARRGVRVSLVVDTFGSSGMEPSHVERLRRAGCQIASFNPPRWYNLEELNYRTHRKILVVDGRVAFTGGAGVADQWLGDAEDAEHWRDTQVRLEGPIARQLEGVFYDDLIETARVVKAELGVGEPEVARDASSPRSPVSTRDSSGDRAPRVDDTGRGDQALIVSGAASGGANALKRLYLLLIAASHRTLDITSPYFLLDESTAWALGDAAARGVKIRLLVEGDKTDAPVVKYASRAAYQRLLDMGVAVHEYQPTMMHAKVLITDGVWSMFGSANFDNRSLELNDELNVAVRSPVLAVRFLQDFEADLRHSHRIDPAAWSDRPFFERTRERFWSYFGEIF